MKNTTPDARKPGPLLATTGPRPRGGHPGLLFAVYAPFGGDPKLSGFPDEKPKTILQHPMLRQLKDVARQGVNVAALIDLLDGETWLVEIPAWRPDLLLLASTWKQAMNRPQALAGFLRRAHHRFPCSQLLLSLEGHGAGYLPEIDATRLTPASATTQGGGTFEWQVSSRGSEVSQTSGPPLLGVGAYVQLPVDSPAGIPPDLPISTWALAQALASARKAGVPRPLVIHFNNCFNMALEHLHTIAPHAEVATGYANYNYFTSGSTYPRLFKRLRLDGPVTPLQFGRWFAEENHRPLEQTGFHPGIGAAMDLKAVRKLAERVDRLAQALTAALRTDRATNFPLIQQAVVGALQYDAGGDYHLDVPDQATDLGTWMEQLRGRFPAGGDVDQAAERVQALLKDVKVYGDQSAPNMDLGEFWDFGHPLAAMSITIPDPLLQGVGDWRAPYYMAGVVDPLRPPALKAQVPFLAHRGPAPGVRAPWPEFLDEYHRGPDDQVVPILRLLPIPKFDFPVYQPNFKPGPDYQPPRDDPKDPKDPNGGGQGGGGDCGR